MHASFKPWSCVSLPIHTHRNTHTHWWWWSLCLTFVRHLLYRHLELVGHEADDGEDDKAGENTGGAVRTGHYYSVPENENKAKGTQIFSWESNSAPYWPRNILHF